MTTNCPDTIKYINQTLTISAITTGGTPPYTYTFWKIPPRGIKKTLKKGIINKITYKITPCDYSNTERLQIGVDIFDSCPKIQTTTESCLITIGICKALDTKRNTIS